MQINKKNKGSWQQLEALLCLIDVARFVSLPQVFSRVLTYLVQRPINDFRRDNIETSSQLGPPSGFLTPKKFIGEY